MYQYIFSGEGEYALDIHHIILSAERSKGDNQRCVRE